MAKMSALAKQFCPDPQHPEQGLQYRCGSYRLQKMIDGHRYNITGDTPEECWERLVDAIRSGEDERQKEQDTREHGPLLKDVADLYLIDLYKMRGGTVRCYKAQVDKAVAKFGERRMFDISPLELKQWIDGLDCAASTARNVKTVLSRLYAKCADVTHNPYNPTADFRLNRGKPKTKRKPPAPACVEALKENAADPDALPALLLLCTGCRIGEAVALQIRDVDFRRRQIVIDKAVEWQGNRPHLTITKTENGYRDVPLMQLLAARLEPLRGLPPETYLIGLGSEPVTACRYKKHWDAYWHRLGFAHETVTEVKRYHNGNPYTTKNHYWHADVTAHQFRHAFVSMLCESGVPEAAAIQIVGHADQKMIHDVYYHISHKMIQNAADLLDQVV